MTAASLAARLRAEAAPNRNDGMIDRALLIEAADELVRVGGRRRIRQAVESRGYQLVTLEWEPWYDAGEKAGTGGGWYGTVDRDFLPRTYPGNEICGLSVEEVLWNIDYFIKPPDPCDCPKPEYAGIYPPAPCWEHAVGCRWRINYWMKWWGPRP